MNIPRIDFLIFGYVDIKISKNDVLNAAECLLDGGVSVKISKNGSFRVPFKNKAYVEEILGKRKIEFSTSEIKGIVGVFLLMKTKIGALVALLFALIFIFFFNGKVWDIRIEGADPELLEKIREDLCEGGLYIGAAWKDIDTDSVEAKTLLASDAVSWLNINRRGTVAYVKVVKKEINEPIPEPTGYANVIAERDCIIEEITVKSGVPAVKVGESVKKGDLLISGIIPTELGGGFCYASGRVIGRYSDRIEITESDTQKKKIYVDEYVEKISVGFLNFSINIFKNYRNYGEECDIIEEKSNFTFSNNKTLPLFLNKTVVREYDVKTVKLSDSDMVTLATDKMKMALLEYLSEKELVSISTDGDFFEGGYIMCSDLVCRAEIAKTQNFNVEK